MNIAYIISKKCEVLFILNDLAKSLKNKKQEN